MGITPADAGKTIMRSLKSCAQMGSPPRMRGKLFGKTSERERRRITPADAGKTLIGFMVGCSAEDHPRGCGENDVRLRKFDPVPGSPPRMRGKPRSAKESALADGITPADAGKTTNHDLKNIEG